MDQELTAYLDERFRETSQQIDGLRRETSQQFKEVREEIVQLRGEVREVREENHLTRVAIEGLRSEVQLVAEGVMGVTERLEAHQSETLLKFDEVRASIVPYYQDLNRRAKLLEGRADRQTRDVIDVIRERFGKS
jgi:hypothetical protein